VEDEDAELADRRKAPSVEEDNNQSVRGEEDIDNQSVEEDNNPNNNNNNTNNKIIT
jgi:hypothetical protein